MWWLSSSSQDPPCWWVLAEALRDAERKVLAEEITEKHGMLLLRQTQFSSVLYNPFFCLFVCFFVCVCLIYIGHHVQLQEKMLSQATQAMKPDWKFLHSLSGLVGSRWPSLAVSLALSELEIEELKAEAELSQPELALQMLKIWASKEEATYGQLCRILKTISLFHY